MNAPLSGSDTLSIRGLKSRVWRFVQLHRRNPLVARISRLCKNIHRASEHPGFDVANNGEQAVLTRVVQSRDAVLFDVGANVGDWTAMARAVHPEAVIHAFELNPPTAQRLSARFTGASGIHIHSFGLAESSGEVDFFSYQDEASVLSGLRTPLHSHVPHTVEKARVRAGAEVCAELGLNTIDYLKVDAEGADLEVLKGFTGLIAAQKIGAIQFEHEGGCFLRDFYDLLTPNEYVIGKIYANYVDFRDHTAEMEHCLGPNYLAIPRGRDVLIRTLKAGW
jgi:FkbM family methyltransferase